VAGLLHQFVDRVVVVELDEAEAAFTAGGFVDHLLDFEDFSEVVEVIFQILVFEVVLQASDEDLLD
jgi:hypothetical protein